MSYALVDNGVAYFCQTIYIGFPGTIVTAFDGFVEQTEYRVVIVGIVFGCVDTSLCGDRVCTTGRILITESGYIVS